MAIERASYPRCGWRRTRIGLHTGVIVPRVLGQQRADLPVLDANPLENISNVRTVRYVRNDGRMFDSDALLTGAGFTP
jgi:hypothetical protein